MTTVQVRKLNFEFDTTIPFQWNPSKPLFGLYTNAISFFAPGFERFIVAATREALREIKEPEARAEAEAFMRQEAQHAKAHRKHVDCLIAQHPGLQQTLEICNEAFDALTRTEPLAYRLAYTAVVEATFTPLFKLMLDHEQELFRTGDERVASLFLWHFVEEIEHRSSALIVYKAAVNRPVYRSRQLVRVIQHASQLFSAIAHSFDEHVPEDARVGSGAELVKQAGLVPPDLTGATTREALGMFWRLLLSQLPYHNPVGQPLPPFADIWFEGYDKEDMDPHHFYSSYGDKVLGV
jgi:predicted metal-dependent hydrolase